MMVADVVTKDACDREMCLPNQEIESTDMSSVNMRSKHGRVEDVLS